MTRLLHRFKPLWYMGFLAGLVLTSCSATNEIGNNTNVSNNNLTIPSNKLAAVTKPTVQEQVFVNKALEKINPKFASPLTKSQTPQSNIAFTEDGSTFPNFVSFLIYEAQKQGFSPNVLSQLSELQFNPKVVRSDKAQYERILANRRKQKDEQKAKLEKEQQENPIYGVGDDESNNQNTTSQAYTSVTIDNNLPESLDLMTKYLSLHISQAKTDRAVALLQNYQFALDKISDTYGVPPEVIVGLWGMESNFGKNQGRYDLLDSLASLAYEGRRREFFTREFFNALRVMEINNFTKNDMKSSWAGAVGQIQFMPTSYIMYGADGNDDGIINIWYSSLDSFASIANYLKTEGWNKDLPWGVAASLSMQQYVDLKDYIGTEASKARTLDQWAELGVNPIQLNNYVLNFDKITPETKFWLVVPTNEPEQAHLVTSNYKVYLHWNRSMYFAFANGKFADSISSIIRNP